MRPLEGVAHQRAIAARLERAAAKHGRLPHRGAALAGGFVLVAPALWRVLFPIEGKRAGLALEFVKEPKEVLAKAKQRPSLIVFDLNFDAAQPLKLIARLKADSETKGISLLGYLSHVQGELKQQAHEAGCNMVLARSQFSQNMPQIFKRHAA